MASDDVSENDEQSCSSVVKRKTRNKEDKTWTEYDELLINAVMKRPCLWDYTIPVKKRSPLSVKEAWLEVKKELDSNIYFNI